MPLILILILMLMSIPSYGNQLRMEPPQEMISFAAGGPPNVVGKWDRLNLSICGGLLTAKLVIRYAGSALRGLRHLI